MDYYDKEYYSKSPMNDPQNIAKAAARVLRGGSWSFIPRDCCAAYRYGNAPGFRQVNAGCRVAQRLD